MELRVIEEGNFRAFDLVIAEIASTRTQVHEHVESVMMSRAALFYDVAISQKCHIDRLRLFPVELKSDSDVIDERLARQVAQALFTFGSSIVVLDVKHAKRMTASACRALPSTVVARTEENEFKVISTFDARAAASVLDFNKRSLTRLLAQKAEISSDRLARRLELIQLIIQKLAFSQLYSEDVKLEEEELEFLQSIVACKTVSMRRLRSMLVMETANAKLTEFMQGSASPK